MLTSHRFHRCPAAAAAAEPVKDKWVRSLCSCRRRRFRRRRFRRRRCVGGGGGVNVGGSALRRSTSYFKRSRLEKASTLVLVRDLPLENVLDLNQVNLNRRLHAQ